MLDRSTMTIIFGEIHKYIQVDRKETLTGRYAMQEYKLFKVFILQPYQKGQESASELCNIWSSSVPNSTIMNKSLFKFTPSM